MLPCAIVALLSIAPMVARAQEPAAGGGAEADLSKQLSNPVSSLISIPFQLNWEFGAGERDPRTVLNFQPVMPFRLSQGWNYIVRIIAPIISQPPVTELGETHFGLGDITLETFLTPANAKGFIWGIGPLVGLPMGSDPFIGSGKWTAGPTAVVLEQTGHWTIGMLANQQWSFAGDGDRRDVSAAFFQPFVAFAATKTVTLTLNSESTANWRADDGDDRWSVPIQLFVSDIVKLGKQPISIQAGGGWFATSPDGGPDWRLRTTFTLLVPAK